MKLLILFFAFFFIVQARAAAKGEAINIYIENDTRDIGGPGSDNAYSSGFKLSYVAAEDDVPPWAQAGFGRVPFLEEAVKKSKSNFGVSIGQQIYTPNDIRRSDLIIDDRPYAAWLYLGLSAQFKNEKRSHVVELDLGVVGPEAGGEAVQNGYHKIIAKYPAEGWRNQLGTEPTLQFSYQQRLKFFDLQHNGNKKFFDAIPFFGGSAGNVAIDAHAGGLVRLGLNLPDDFGPSRPSTSEADSFVSPDTPIESQKSFYLFASGRGIAVGHDIFLDGNTFRPSHKVTKYPFIVETEVGAVGGYGHWNAAWRFVTRSPEFEQKSVFNSFASISLGYIF